MAGEIILTKEGLEDAKKKLKNLVEVVRPAVIEELVEARNEGDLSENADYDAARNKQAEVEAKIKELEAMISKAKVIDAKGKKGEVKLGSTITFTNKKTKKDWTVKIVGSVEANPFEGLISNDTPLAKAMLGHKQGEIVEVREAKEPYKIEIKTVK